MPHVEEDYFEPLRRANADGALGPGSFTTFGAFFDTMKAWGGADIPDSLIYSIWGLQEDALIQAGAKVVQIGEYRRFALPGTNWPLYGIERASSLLGMGNDVLGGNVSTPPEPTVTRRERKDGSEYYTIRGVGVRGRGSFSRENAMKFTSEWKGLKNENRETVKREIRQERRERAEQRKASRRPS